MKLMPFLLVLIFSCATGYKKKGFTGGYDDMDLGNNMYQVSFKGNAFTSKDDVQKGFMRRCAELTVENKMDSFLILGEETDTEGNVSAHTNYYTGSTTFSKTNKHERVGRIKLFKKSNQPATAIDAKVFLKNFSE